MAQLRAILDQSDPVFHQNFQALAEVQRHEPRAVAELLGGPQVGAWAARCLRLLSHGEPDATHHLGGIAVAAAVLAGRHIRAVVPVRAGAVHLPSVGRALVSGPAHRLAECVVGPDGLRIDGATTEAWHPVRLLQTEAAGVRLRVQIDDMDPYWRVFGIPVDELTDVAAWQHHLDGAWRVLADRHAHRLDTIAAAVRCLVPVRQAGFGGSSASSADAPGAAALTEPTNPVRFAATLVHESQHYRLATLHDLRRLFSGTQLTYSPWRNDPRPPAGIVHALMAFAGVADFWSRERTGPASELEYARLVRQLRVAHSLARGMPGLTTLGASLVDALGDSITALPLDAESDDVSRIADDLITEHRARWRLRNIPAVGAWAYGDPLPEDDAAPAPGAPSGDHPLARLAMAWLENAAQVRALAVDEDLFAQRFPGAVPGDLHLLAGRYDAARDDALGRIERATADDHTWATLVVAHGHAATELSPLVRRPELVRAALSPGGTGQLRALLARYETGTSMSDTMRR